MFTSTSGCSPSERPKEAFLGKELPTDVRGAGPGGGLSEGVLGEIQGEPTSDLLCLYLAPHPPPATSWAVWVLAAAWPSEGEDPCLDVWHLLG